MIPIKIKRFFCLHDYQELSKQYHVKGYVTYFFRCSKCGKHIAETWVVQFAKDTFCELDGDIFEIKIMYN